MKSIRWKIFIPLFLLFAASFCFFLFLGSIIKVASVKTGEALVKAKVDIADVDVQYFPFRIVYKDVAVSNPSSPMSNLLEFERAEAGLSFLALLEKKVLIEHVGIVNLSVHTARSKSGALPKKEQKRKKKTKTKRSKEKVADAFSDLPDVSDIAKGATKGSKAAFQKAEKDLAAVKKEWSAVLDSSDITKQLDDLGDGLKNIQSAKVNSLGDIQALLSDVDPLSKQLKSLQSSVTKRKKSVDKGFSTMSKSIADIQKAANKDFAEASSLLSVDSLDGGMTEQFGLGSIRAKFEPTLALLEQVLTYKKKLSPEKPEKKGRYEGVTAHFAKKQQLPALWIKRLSLSGKGKNGQLIAGGITDISNDNNLIDRPMIAQIQGQHILGKGTEFRAVVRQEGGETTIQSTLTGVTLAPRSLFNDNGKKIKLNSGRSNSDFSMKIVGNYLEGKLLWKGQKLDVATSGFSKNSNNIDALFSELLSTVNEVDLVLKINGTWQKPGLRIDSSLDEQLASAFNKLTKQRLKDMKAELKREIDKEVSGYQSQLTQVLDQQKSILDAQLKKEQDKLKGYQKRLDAETKKAKNALKAEEDKLKNEAKKAANKAIKQLRF